MTDLERIELAARRASGRQEPGWESLSAFADEVARLIKDEKECQEEKEYQDWKRGLK